VKAKINRIVSFPSYDPTSGPIALRSEESEILFERSEFISLRLKSVMGEEES
jgi:hypothetical protein